MPQPRRLHNLQSNKIHWLRFAPGTNGQLRPDNAFMSQNPASPSPGSPNPASNNPTSHKPAIRRLKTYAGAQGYVYQYYFVGQRPALENDSEAPAKEFVFDVTSDRKLTYAVSIFLPQKTLAVWSETHGRPLNEAEQYAAVKLRLLRAFDELQDVKTHGRRLTIDTALLDEALASLGVE
jgi:hypothetical protein